jgi:aerobic carbon-monoxide dehydrogenase small subunit
MPVRLRVNGTEHHLTVEPRATLADTLRGDLGLTGTRLGCEHGVCGSCTVLLDGAPVRSCLLLTVQCGRSEIRTVEGLAENGRLHPRRLDEVLASNLCRCTGYHGIRRAVVSAVRRVRRSR